MCLKQEEVGYFFQDDMYMELPSKQIATKSMMYGLHTDDDSNQYPSFK